MTQVKPPKTIRPDQGKGPLSNLEQKFIKDYLHAKGHTFASLKGLPEHEAKQILLEASKYASLKLAEIEARASFREKIHK